MNLKQLLKFANDYSDLGTAVQEQLNDQVMGWSNLQDCNPNALKMIKDLFRDFSFDLSQAGEKDWELERELDDVVNDLDQHLSTVDF